MTALSWRPRRVERLKSLGVEAFSVAGDVSVAKSVTVTFEKVAERLQHLDLLVNNAGIQIWKALLDLTEKIGTA
jgi:NAD(P)-dependent dehydrogenase (short-subunit alcohol dehydrogenase family)